MSSADIEATGNMAFLHKESVTNIELIVKKVDLNKLFAAENKNINSLSFFQKYLESRKDITSSGKVLITIDEIYFNDDVINNMKFISEINGKSTEITNFTFDMPGKTKVSIDGKLSSDGIISSFEGGLMLSSKNVSQMAEWLFPAQKVVVGEHLTLKSNILLSPQTLLLNDVEVLFDDVIARSKLYVKSDQKNNKIRGRIDISGLRLDKYQFIYNMFDSADVYKIYSDIDFNINMHDVYYQKNLFENISLQILSETGKLLLKDINLKSKQIDLKCKCLNYLIRV